MEGCPEGNCSGQATDEFSVTFVAVEATLVFMIILASTICNLLVAVAIVRRPDMISWSSNKLLLNLTVANFVLSVSVLPFVFASSLKRSWPVDVGWCTFNGFATTLLCTGSVWTAMFLSIDRYHYIVNPLNYANIMSVTRTYFFIGFSWAVSFFTAILPIAGWGSPYGFKNSSSTCMVAWNSVQSDGYTKFHVCAAFIFPLIVMLWAYFHIVKAARRQARVVHIAALARSVRASISSTASLFTGYKALWATFLALGALLFLWGPYVMLLLLNSARVDVSRGVEVTAVLLSFSSAAVYPVIYGFRVRAIKKEVRRIVYKLLCFESRNIVRPFSASDGGFVTSHPLHFRTRSVSDGSLDLGHFAPNGIGRHESSFGLPPINEEEEEQEDSSLDVRTRPTCSTGVDFSTEVTLPGAVV